MTAFYITRDELQEMSLPLGAQGKLTDSQIDLCISRACAQADNYLKARYSLPLISWGDDLRGWVSDICAFYCLKQVGFNPEFGAHLVFKEAHDEAIKNLLLVSKRLLHPTLSDSSVRTRVPRSVSNKTRGW